jgi:hypothetical protein
MQYSLANVLLFMLGTVGGIAIVGGVSEWVLGLIRRTASSRRPVSADVELPADAIPRQGRRTRSPSVSSVS